VVRIQHENPEEDIRMAQKPGVYDLTAAETRELGEAHPHLRDVGAALVIVGRRPQLARIRTIAEAVLEHETVPEEFLSLTARPPVAEAIDEHRFVAMKRRAEARRHTAALDG
jgi:hypothetical protein